MQRAGRQCGPKRALQRRGYLNLYPKPDSGTGVSPTDMTAYYQLPEYLAHKDHKQLRPIELDRTNTSELTREEERIQRIKVMNWRQAMARDGAKATSLENAELPLWEAVEESSGRGRFREAWSGAQLLEYLIRSGADLRSVEPEAELAHTDPHGAAASPAACFELTTPMYTEPISFRTAISSQTLNILSQRYTRLAGNNAVFPAAGFDLPAVANALSKGIEEAAASGRGLSAFADAKRFLADLTAAVHAGLTEKGLEDDVVAALALSCALEAHLDVFSAASAHQVDASAERLSEDSFQELAKAYPSGGYWAALKNSPECSAGYSLFLDAFNPAVLEPGQINEVTRRLSELFRQYADIADACFTASVARGERPARFAATDADWIELAEKLIVAPYAEWVETGAFPYDVYGDSAEDIKSLFEVQTVVEGLTFGEFLRWSGHVEQIAIPAKLASSVLKADVQAVSEDAAAPEDDEEFDVLAGDDDEEAPKEATTSSSAASLPPSLRAVLPSGGPAPQVAARLCNLTFRGAFESFSEDLAAHIKLLRKTTPARPDSVPSMSFFQFLRCLTNSSNIPSYNAAKSSASFSSAAAAARYHRALAAAGNDPAAMHDKNVLKEEGFALDRTTGVGGVALYDAASIAAELFIADEKRDWSTAEMAAHARELCRRDSQADMLFFSLRRMLPFAQARCDTLQLMREVVADVDDCIGFLRRRNATRRDAGAQEKLAADGFDVRSVAVDTPKGAYTGCTATVSWEWTPTETYRLQVAPADKKEAASRSILQSQATDAQETNNPDKMVSEVLDKVMSYGQTETGPSEDRMDWAFTQMYHKWKRSGEEAKAREAVSIEQRHRVHVALYKKGSDSAEAQIAAFNDRRSRINAALHHEPDEGASHSHESVRLREILRQVRQWAVESFAEKIEHSLGSDVANAELLGAMQSGELNDMLSSTDFLTPQFLEQADSLWDYECDLAEVAGETFANTGSLPVRIPFERDGRAIEDGTYRVAVVGLSASGEWRTVGQSEEFAVKHSADDLIAGFLKRGRAGGRHLGEVDGKHVLVPVEDVPRAITYFKGNSEYPLSLDLASESRIGADVINAQGKAFVHINVLRADLTRDHHREERRAEPVQRYLDSQEAVKKGLFLELNPGASRTELARNYQASVKARFHGDSNIGWLSHDDELLNTTLAKSTPADKPVERLLNRKFANLFTDSASRLGTVRYEGMGFVSQFSLSEDLRRMRAPLPAASDSASLEVKVADQDTGVVFTVKQTDTAVVAVPEGGSEHTLHEMSFDDVAWSVDLGGVIVKLPEGDEGDRVLAELRHLADASHDRGLRSTIPAEIPLQLHHYAAISKSLINGAHTEHALLAKQVAAAKAASDRDYDAAYPPPAAQAEEHDRLLPTMVRAWQDAGSQQAELSPIGQHQHRRRFDSWQLLSGSGRYDVSPTKGQQWKHPVEENPTQYRFQDVQAPFSSM